MAAPAADLIRTLSQRASIACKVKNAASVFAGYHVALEPATGRFKQFAGAAGDIPVGLMDGTPFFGSTTPPAAGGVLGDTSAAVEPLLTALAQGTYAERVTVAGVSAITDVGKRVYLVDTDATFTLTRPTYGVPVGVVINWHTSTTCDVYFFSLAEILVLGMAGNAQQLMNLGHFDVNTLANGDIRTGIPLPFHGKFLSVFGMIDVNPAGSGGTALINLEIGGTNVTGGVVTIATGDTKGMKKAGTAVTAANEFHEGDLLDIEAASVVDMSAGAFDLFAEVELLPGC